MLPAPSTDPAGAVVRRIRRHGTRYCYHQGCRRPECREAWRLYAKRMREGRLRPYLVDRTGTERRIQGLMALGWRAIDIAVAAGLPSARSVSGLCHRSPQVQAVSAEAIRKATARLGSQTGPSDNTRRRARELGYLPLWVWDDDIDDPAAKPQGTLPRPRRRPGMARLTAADLARFERYRQPAGACARWTGCVDEAGRGKFALHGVGRNTTVRARRVAYWLHTGRDAAGEVRTSCGNSWCCAGPHMVDGAQVRKAAA